jgi:hypothetical protein
MDFEGRAPTRKSVAISAVHGRRDVIVAPPQLCDAELKAIALARRSGGRRN